MNKKVIYYDGKVVVLNEKYDYKKILSAMARELDDDNPTMDAIGKKFNKRNRKFINTI